MTELMDGLRASLAQWLADNTSNADGDQWPGYDLPQAVDELLALPQLVKALKETDAPLRPHAVSLMALPDRLMRERLVTEAGCWEWTGSRYRQGYGRIRWQGKTYRVTRLVAAQWLGLDLSDTETHVRHACDNPPCFNPDHLSLGKHEDNMQDMVSRGRHWQASKTHCIKGHPFDEANTFREGPNRRKCRTCRAAHTAAYKVTAAAAGFSTRNLCVDCKHHRSLHSSEPGVGCLHRVYDSPQLAYVCPCLRPGTSQADQ